MRILIIAGLLLVSLSVAAQQDSVGLKQAMQQLDKALMENDSLQLQKLLHEQLSFGHSNGWIQSKQEAMTDGKKGKLLYKKIEHQQVNILSIDNQHAVVRTSTAVEGVVGDKTFQLLLHLLQVWVKEKAGWQLMGRQSIKIN